MSVAHNTDIARFLKTSMPKRIGVAERAREAARVERIRFGARRREVTRDDAAFAIEQLEALAAEETQRRARGLPPLFTRADVIALVARASEPCIREDKDRGKPTRQTEAQYRKALDLATLLAARTKIDMDAPPAMSARATPHKRSP